MAVSRRQRILEALTARVSAITVANGFNTDAGKHVYLGVIPTLGEDDEDENEAIAIIVGEDAVDPAAMSKLPILLPINIAALARPDLDEPWLIVEAVLTDIKKAVELEDRSLGGLLRGGRNNPEGLMRGTTEILERRSGTDTVGAAVTYVAPYSESWGSPEA